MRTINLRCHTEAIRATVDTIMQEELRSRSKSMGFLDKLYDDYEFKCFCRYSGRNKRHASISSAGGCLEDDGTESSVEDTKSDNCMGKSSMDTETFLLLDQKIEKLSDFIQEQRNLLISIKENVIGSKAGSFHQVPECKKYSGVEYAEGIEEEAMLMNETETTNGGSSCDVAANCGEAVSAARSLLGAIEMRRHSALEHIVKNALENFLQSDDVKEQVSAAAAECARGAVRGGVRRALAAVYLPAVERSHRRLLKHVTELLDHSFADLEESTASLFKSIHRASRSIRLSLQKHQNQLEATDPLRNIKLLRTSLKSVLEDELWSWRGKVVHELALQGAWEASCDRESRESPLPNVDCSPLSPMQPANPEASVIDTLMKCALINKHVQDGDINGAFEEALNSADLSLVMAACRAADPAACSLRPAVLLSLLQQLATDMVHDTQLKCRYLEEAILSLDNCDSGTREHLPLVVTEVRQHLSKFLLSYPKHHASRRIALIVMAADNLLK